MLCFVNMFSFSHAICKLLSFLFLHFNLVLLRMTILIMYIEKRLFAKHYVVHCSYYLFGADIDCSIIHSCEYSFTSFLLPILTACMNFSVYIHCFQWKKSYYERPRAFVHIFYLTSVNLFFCLIYIPVKRQSLISAWN